MKLTQYTDYGLRTLIALGLNPGKAQTVATIADAYGISRNHLVKVVTRLAGRGYVVTLRGKGGGVRLARAPREICIGAVVRDMESELGVVECLSRQQAGHCVIAPNCRLKELFQSATDAFLNTLDQRTLKDLLRQRAPVAQLLQIPIRAKKRS